MALGTQINPISFPGNPFDAAMQGYDRAQQRLDQNQQRLDQNQQRESKALMQKELVTLIDKPGGATPDDISNIMLKYPNIANSLQPVFNNASFNEKKAYIAKNIPIYTSLQKGDKDTAIKQLKLQQEAAINSGNEEDANELEILIKQTELNPEAAAFSIGASLNHIMGGEFRKLKERQGSVSFDTLTDPTTGEAYRVGYDINGNVVSRVRVEGLRKSSALSVGEKTKSASETTRARNEAAEPFRDREIMMKTIRSPEYTGISTGLSSVNEALNLLDKDPTLYRDVVGIKTGRGEGAKLNTNVQTAIRLFVQSISGKVVTDAEAKAYQRAFNPSFVNEPEIAKFKLERLQELLELTKLLKLDPENEGIKNSIRDVVKEEGAGAGVSDSASYIKQNISFGRIITKPDGSRYEYTGGPVDDEKSYKRVN